MCGTTLDENESPPLEGSRGGPFQREDLPLKAKACSFLKAARHTKEELFKEDDST